MYCNMKKINLLLIFCALSLAIYAQDGKVLTLKDAVTGKYNGERLGELVPMADGEHYTMLSHDRKRIVKYSFKTGKEVETLFDVSTARECTFKTFDGYQLSPDETKILIQTETKPIYRRSFTAVHYVYTIKRNLVEKLSDGGPQQVPTFSPDGNMVAFVRNNNIFLVKFLYGNSESQVTTDGSFGKIINGAPDWVYEEEFEYNRALEFSPDNLMITFVRFDETAVPSYSFPLYAGQYPTNKENEYYPGSYSYKYPKSGQTNSTVTVHSFDIKSKVIRKLNIPIKKEDYIPRIRFTKDASKLAVMTLNRTQNQFDMYFVNPRSGVAKLILRDESKYYINENNFDNIVFYDNNFSFLSEKDGFSHLYWYSIGGNLVKQVTKGKFEVSKYHGWDSATNTFYYESNEGNPLRKAVYAIDAKGRKSKLTEKEGTNNAIFGRTMKYFINTFSNLTTPPVVTLNDNKGKELGVLISNSKLKEEISKMVLPKKEFFSFTTSAGVQLNGWMIKPADFSESKKYPVILYQYSGPGTQEVADRWSLGGIRSGLGWEAYMATQGYIVACVDGRGTGGRGEEFTKCTYMNLGVKEAQDQAETAKYFNNQQYVDKGRIGIWGWSFGGYMTIMSMSEGSNVFKAGVAVAPVTDWKFYDSVYTERFMRTPQENADGYASSSAFTRAGNLSGKLLIVHGMADDNVHFQNTAEYSEQLVQSNKQFDMQVYTNRNHSIYGGNTRYHLFTKITEFFRNNL